MTIPFEAKRGVKDACKTIKEFIKDNKSELWHIFKINMPYKKSRINEYR